jgi:hypothetical protein
MSGPVNGVQRVFHVARDAAGNNALWEAFSPDRRDNEAPIKCYVETKTHLEFSPKATGLDLKKFLFAELSFCEVVGSVDVSVYWAGTRGRYKKLADFTVKAEEGAWKSGVPVQVGTAVPGYAPQTRVVRLPALDPKLSACSVTGIESPRLDEVDIGFSLLVVWSGRAALRSYRIFADPEQETGTGAAPVSETEAKPVVATLCSAP